MQQRPFLEIMQLVRMAHGQEELEASWMLLGRKEILSATFLVLHRIGAIICYAISDRVVLGEPWLYVAQAVTKVGALATGMAQYLVTP